MKTFIDIVARVCIVNETYSSSGRKRERIAFFGRTESDAVVLRVFASLRAGNDPMDIEEVIVVFAADQALSARLLE